MVSLSSCVPAIKSLSSVCSAGLWLMPSKLGTKIMPVGQIRAIIWASWPAPEGMRFVERPVCWANSSICSTTLLSNSTGSKRASDLVSTFRPSSLEKNATQLWSSSSACWSKASSVLRRSTVIVALAGTTFTRFGCRCRFRCKCRCRCRCRCRCGCRCL